MWKLFIAAIAFAAWSGFTAPAFAVNCGNYCVGKCTNSHGSGHNYCMTACMQRCEAASKKRH
jgi:hypothetical protein